MFSNMMFLHLVSIIISVLVFVHVAATVPASVLAKNTELAKEHNNDNNNNGKSQVFRSNANNLHDDTNNYQELINKVKRSSNIGQNLSSESSSMSILNSVLDKKSSPEVVPAVFNSPRQMINTQPDQDQELQLQQQYQQQRLRQQNQQQQQQLESASSLKEAGLSGLSALSAGITAELQQQKLIKQQLQQQKQQQSLSSQNYDDDFSNYNNNYDYESPRSLMQKRGIDIHPYLYGRGLSALDGSTLQRDANYENYVPEYYKNTNNNKINSYGLENSLLTDDEDVGNIMYNDLDDYEQTSRGSNYRSKAYDNLQSILNSEANSEPQKVQSPVVYMPLQYNNGYYGGALEHIDREKNKRPFQNTKNNNNKYADMPSKRDAKLSPADMLALVALLEAGDRARTEKDEEPAYISPGAETYNFRTYYNTPNPYEYAQVLNSPLEELNFNAANANEAWVDPSTAMNGFYGLPINVETEPKYEVRKYGAGNGNRYNNKRLMVAKKKRSPMGQTSYNYAGEKNF